MSWSLSELHALSRQAARGAGYDWGMADEAAHAARWLCRRGLQGDVALAHLLTARAGGADPASCPLRMGCAVADAALAPDALAGRTIVSPLLLLPFLDAAYAAEGRPAGVEIGGRAFAWSADGWRAAGGAAAPEGRAIPIDPAAIQGDPLPTDRRPDPDAATISRLEAFAARVRAPATEESRRKGAGGD